MDARTDYAPSPPTPRSYEGIPGLMGCAQGYFWQVGWSVTKPGWGHQPYTPRSRCVSFCPVTNQTRSWWLETTTTYSSSLHPV